MQGCSFEFDNISDYLENVREILGIIPCGEIESVISLLLETSNGGGAIFVFGNGGSAALASHIACDLGKGTADIIAKRFRVIALTDNVPLITAWANDSNYQEIFAEQLKNHLQPGDLALAISGSGNSPNVLKGLRAARALGASTVGLTGFGGGRMKELCDTCVVVPSDNMQIIEDAHTVLAHGLFSVLRSRLHRAKVLHAVSGQM